MPIFRLCSFSDRLQGVNSEGLLEDDSLNINISIRCRSEALAKALFSFCSSTKTEVKMLVFSLFTLLDSYFVVKVKLLGGSVWLQQHSSKLKDPLHSWELADLRDQLWGSALRVQFSFDRFSEG
ncbi:hypothetical protein Tco_0712946, partial [Tanacetum coccineum]